MKDVHLIYEMESMEDEDYNDDGEQAMETEDVDMLDDEADVSSKAGAVGPLLPGQNCESYAMPLFENGRFRSPWGAVSHPRMVDCFKHMLSSKREAKVPRTQILDKTLPVVKPDLQEFETSPPSGVRHLWIGHSTSLVQVDGLTILTDPIFSERCSPVQCFGHKRFRPTPCSIAQLPPVDVVLISHTHYDHLDYGSVVALNEKYGESICWYVPQGLMKWMNDCGCHNVREMTWWQELIHSEDSDVRIACTPSQHWGKRTSFDENKVLWCSWCVIGPRHSFFFAGDTAYCKGFQDIGARYGPFTLATIPIGAYSPRSVMAESNADPENAVNIHIDIQSQSSIGIHWGTFCIGDEPYLEPRELLTEEVRKRRMKPCSFFTVKHGEVSLVGSDGFDELD